jgi:steroid delta-isomerase
MTLAIGTAEEAARRFYDCVDGNDVPGLAALFAPGSSYHRPGYEPYLGPEGMTRFYGSERVIRSGRHTLTTIVATGHDVAVRGEFHGELHDGSPVDLRFADFFETGPDGRFTRRETFFFAPLA